MRSSRLAVAVALCAGTVAPVASFSAACAGEGARAALVIDTGAAVSTYCVALPDESVTGIELVELAGEQHGLDYSLGFGGEAVCRLEGVGAEGDDCWAEYPEYWGYWHGNGSGGWTWAGSGAGYASIEDGDVDGWSWGTGDNGSNHPAPPATEHDDVCVPVEQPGEEQGPRARGPRAPRGGDPGPSSDGSTEDAVAKADSPGSKSARRKDPGGREGRRHSQIGLRRDPAPAPAPAMTPSPAPTSLAAEPANDESSGPPVTGLLGLVAAGAVAFAAWTTSRRRVRSR